MRDEKIEQHIPGGLAEKPAYHGIATPAHSVLMTGGVDQARRYSVFAGSAVDQPEYRAFELAERRRHYPQAVVTAARRGWCDNAPRMMTTMIG